MIIKVKELFKQIFLVAKACPFCGKKFNTNGPICPKCSDTIKKYNRQEFCRTCGKFISIDSRKILDKPSNQGNSARGKIQCKQCQLERPPYTVARGVVLYNELFRENIYKFKYHGHRSLAPVMAGMMIEKIITNPEFSSIDAIVPIPLTGKKLLKRRYNHTELLANEIGKFLNIQVFPDALIRVKDNSSQSKLNREERVLNIKNAFKPNIEYNILNKKILLVDDIVTTGATITECSKLLKINGAKEILVISLVTGRTNLKLEES